MWYGGSWWSSSTPMNGGFEVSRVGASEADIPLAFCSEEGYCQEAGRERREESK